MLAGAELGDSVDEVDSLLRKHENTERLTASQDEKVTNLCEFGDTLVENGHNESDMIKVRVKAVCDRRNKLKEELGKRRNKLEESKKIAQFYQDVVEVRAVNLCFIPVPARTSLIGHFRIVPSLCFKVRLIVKPLI